MAGSLNKVLLIGRLGADPEIKQMVNGKSVARLSLATSQSWKDKYSTEIVIQGYNSSLTMLGGGNSAGGIQYDNNQSPSNSSEDASQVSNDMDDEIPF